MGSCCSKILVVDDEPQILVSVRAALNSTGWKDVSMESDSRKVMDLLQRDEFSVVVLDLLMPGITGLELLQVINERYPKISVIMLTAVNEVETAVNCMKAGAVDYLVKPIRREELVNAVKRVIKQQLLQSEVQSLKKHLLSDILENEEIFSSIITTSTKMKNLFQYIEAIAPSCQPVLLEGETGTGKELFARAVHQVSRPSRPFVAVNVAGLDDTTFSDTLFGHVRGAYTGADKSRDGMINKAGDGILFLDEIGDLDQTSQIKLLRLFQEKSYQPLGSDISKKTEARFIVATNVDLAEAVRAGKFRKDLFYRLKSHQIIIPPLRERLEDLPLLVDHFLYKAAAELGKKKPTPPHELFTLLATYPFPGNVRELEALIHDAVSRHNGGKLSLSSFKETVYDSRGSKGQRVAEPDKASLSLSYKGRLPTLKEAEELVIVEAMRQADNNQGIASSFLGISRQALNRRLLIMKSEE